MSLILGILDSGGAAAGAAGSYESIATVTVGSGGSSSIEFTSIPATYTHLQIRGIGTCTRNIGTMDLNITFNSDTGANYSWHMIVGNGSAVDAYNGTSTTYMKTMIYSLPTANVYGAGVIDILDYANTNKYKTVRSLNGCDNNAGTTDSQMYFASGNWRSTSAITSITVKSLAGFNFTTASKVSLYGIKGA